MDIAALTTLLQALENRRETEDRQREERYTALIERMADYKAGAAARSQPGPERTRAPALRAPHLHQSTQSGDVLL
ncbi:UNVERIFIED_CONTAM: hypothetical protein FKN15_031988 [Acipenser sinensis]